MCAPPLQRALQTGTKVDQGAIRSGWVRPETETETETVPPDSADSLV